MRSITYIMEGMRKREKLTTRTWEENFLYLLLVELLFFLFFKILIRLTISEIYILIYSSAYIDDWHETSKDYSSIYCNVVVGYLQSNDCGSLLNDYIFKISFLHFHPNFCLKYLVLSLVVSACYEPIQWRCTLKDKPYASLSLM